MTAFCVSVIDTIEVISAHEKGTYSSIQETDIKTFKGGKKSFNGEIVHLSERQRDRLSDL